MTNFIFWGTLFWVTVMLVANYISLVNNRFKGGVGSRVDISAKNGFVEQNFSQSRRFVRFSAYPAICRRRPKNAYFAVPKFPPWLDHTASSNIKSAFLNLTGIFVQAQCTIAEISKMIITQNLFSLLRKLQAPQMLRNLWRFFLMHRIRRTRIFVFLPRIF